MKCQSLFTRNNKKNTINLSSAELALRVVKVNTKQIGSNHILNLILLFLEKIRWNVKPYFLVKIQKSKCHLL